MLRNLYQGLRRSVNNRGPLSCQWLARAAADIFQSDTQLQAVPSSPGRPNATPQGSQALDSTSKVDFDRSSVRSVWVKKEGDPSFVHLRTKAASVSELCDEAILQLPLAGVRRGTATLHTAPVDAQGRQLADAAAEPSPPGASLADAGIGAGFGVIVKVAAEWDLKAFENVATLPPITTAPHVDSDSLKVILDSKADPVARLSAFSSIATATMSSLNLDARTLGISLPLFSTESHVQLLQVVMHHAGLLAGNKYEHVNGASCRAVVGAAGVGKTNLLRAFTLVCAVLFPKVIPVFVSCLGIETPSSSFARADLHQLLFAAAREQGLALDGAQGKAHSLTAALLESDRFIFLVVDELDELYRLRTSSDPTVRRNALQTLYTLCQLGDNTSGRYSVLLCGSSYSLYQLVCHQITRELAEQFPLGPDAPGLHRTKFPDVLIPSARCTDSSQVLAIIETLRMWPADTPHWQRLAQARMVTFLGGTTSRATIDAVTAAHVGDCSPAQLLSIVQRQLRGSRAVTQDGAVMLEEVQWLLRKANAALLRRLRLPDGSCAVEELVHVDHALPLTADDARAPFSLPPSGECHLLYVAAEAAAGKPSWESLVRPVSWDAVMKAWARRCKADGRRTDYAYAEVLLSSLADASLLSIRSDAGPLVRAVWPTSAAQLVFGHSPDLDVSTAARAMESLTRALHPFASAAKELRL